MPIITPWYSINKIGGLDDIFDSTVKRIVDDFEAYLLDFDLDLVWTNTLGAGLPVLETALPVYGAKSLKVTVTPAPVVGANLYDASVGYTNYTAEANSAAPNDVVLLPAAGVLQINDAFYIGAYYPFKKCTINVGTAGVGAWVGVWEYWNGTAWTAVTVTDGTVGFTVAGSNDVVITTMPTDWRLTNNGGLLSASCFWLRYRLTVGDAAPVTRPLGTQIWIKYGVVARDFPMDKFGYFYPGNLRYLRFRATALTQTSDIIAVTRDASNPYGLFRGYDFVIGNENSREMTCELDSAGDLDCYGATSWDQLLADEIAFVFLDTGIFKLDQIEVYDDVAIMDRLGIGTEPATLDGVEGTVQSKLRTVFTKLDEILGETEQYVKFGPAMCELNYAYTWGLELKAEGAAPIADYTITPGLVDIKRLRLGVETAILTDQAALEQDGRIYYQYTPTEADFALGDEIILRFHGGTTDEPVGTTWNLLMNVAAIDTTLTFTAPQAFQMEIGDRLWLRDNVTPAGQIVVVLSVDGPTQITLTGAVGTAYTTAQTVRVTKTVHTALEPAWLFSTISRLPDINADVKYGLLSDWDTFDIADVAPVLTSKWVGEVYSGVGQDSTAAMAGGFAVVTADPSASLSSGYWLRHATVINSKSFNVIVDLSSIAWGTANATGASVGLYITPGVAYDPTNYVLIARQKTNAVNNIKVTAVFVGGTGFNQTVAITEDTLAFSIERRGNIWRVYYSSSTYPSYNWVLASSFIADDTLCSMGPNVSACLYAYSGGAAATNTVSGSFDNFQYYINDRSYETWIAGVSTFMSGGAQRSLADMPYITAKVDCNPSPQVDQDSMQAARISIENARTDSDLILATEYASTAITIERYRQGLDVDWTNKNAGPVAMTEASGYAYYNFTFPAVGWMNGDLVRYVISGCVVTIGGQTFQVPPMTAHGVVGGISAIMKKLDLLQEVLFMSDFDLFDVDYAHPINNERWTGSNYTGAAEASQAAITGGKAVVLADPDGTPVATGYGLIHKPAHNGRHFDVIVDADYTWGTQGAGYLMGGLMVFRGASTYAAAVTTGGLNYLYAVRQKSTTAATNNIIVAGMLDGVAVPGVTAAITDDAIALRITRNENIWRFYYSLTKSPNYYWTLITQVNDASNFMGNEVSDMLFASSPGVNDAESLSVSFDNYKVYTNFGILEKLGYIIVSEGKFTTSHASTLADTSQSIKATGFFNGNLVMPIEGALAGQARLIVSFTTGTGQIQLDPDHPFTAAPGLVRYVILAYQGALVPTADATNNYTESEVIGNKADNDRYILDSNRSLMAYVKGILKSHVISTGTFDGADSATAPRDSGKAGVPTDYYKGCWLMPLGSSLTVPFQPRLIVGFTTGTGIYTLDPEQPFTAAPGLVAYAVLAPNSQMVPGANVSSNYTPAHVVGNKADTSPLQNVASADTDSVIKHLKALRKTVGQTPADPDDSLLTITGQRDDTIPAMNLAPADDSMVKQLKAILERVGATPNDPDDSLLTVVGQRDDTVTVAATASLVALLRDLIAALGVVASGAGGGFEIDGTPNLVQALGTTGAVVTDTATSVLGAIGADNADNAFGSSAVVANNNGSVLEREEYIQAQLDTGTRLLTSTAINATGVLVTAAEITEASGWWRGALVLGLTGHNIMVIRPVIANTVGTLTVQPAFMEAIAVADTFLLISTYAGLGDSSGLFYMGTCESGSATTAVCLAMAGFGHDFFNTKFYIQITYNTDSHGNSPEPKTRLITDYDSTTGGFTFGTVTDAVAAGDKILILHESLINSSNSILARGTFTVSLTTVPADSTSGIQAKATGYYNNCWLMPLTGVAAFQPRLIVVFTTATGVFTLDPETPFLAAPGLVDYVVLAPTGALVPGVDVGSNYTPAHVIGNKTDTIPAMSAVPGNDSMVRHLKAILERVGATPGDPDDSLMTVVGQRDDGVTVAATASLVALLRDLIAALGVVAAGAGTGFEIDGTPNLVQALGTTGATVTDSATSVLGAIGANSNDNAFASDDVVGNANGSVLEREEYIQAQMAAGVRSLTTTGASTTVISSAAITEAAGFWKNALVVGTIGTNVGIARHVISNTVGTLTVYPAMPAATVNGDQFLLISSYKPQVTTQLAAVPVNLSIVQAAVATTVFDLSTAGFSYMVNSLRLKSADPGATQTITVRLYELINALSVGVSSFAITTVNFGTYFSLVDMFGVQHLAGDNLKVTVELSAGATTPVVVTGQYQNSLVYTGAG